MSAIKEYLGDKSLYKKMFKIAVPISLQSLITVGINLMDTVMLSDMGDAQLSASSLAGQFINIFMICCMGIGMGASVLTSRFWGMKDMNSLKKSITLMLRFCVIFSAVFTLATIAVPRLIMRMYSNDAEIVSYGVLYLRWMIPTYICMGLSTVWKIFPAGRAKAAVPPHGKRTTPFLNTRGMKPNRCATCSGTSSVICGAERKFPPGS